MTDDEGKRTVAVGDTVEAIIASASDDGIVLRVRAGRGPAAPAELQQAYTYGLTASSVSRFGCSRARFWTVTSNPLWQTMRRRMSLRASPVASLDPRMVPKNPVPVR